MKFALNTLGCPDWTFDQILENAKENGINYIEIRGINGKMRADEIEELTLERYPAFAEKLNSYGIEIVGFGASSSFHDPANCEKAYKEAIEAVEICNRLGINFVRVFGNNVPDTENESEIIERVAYHCRKLCDHALMLDSKTPVNILLEAHGDFNTHQRLFAVCSKVDRANFGIIWDVAHTDKAYADNYIEFYRLMKPYIRHVHFKDHLRAESGFKICSVGEGDIPLINILETLKKDSFSGCISLEHEKKWVPDLAEPEEEFKRFAEYIKNYK